MSSSGSHYEVLGVKHDASTSDIMSAYNNKVQKVYIRPISTNSLR